MNRARILLLTLTVATLPFLTACSKEVTFEGMKSKKQLGLSDNGDGNPHPTPTPTVTVTPTPTVTVTPTPTPTVTVTPTPTPTVTVTPTPTPTPTTTPPCVTCVPHALDFNKDFVISPSEFYRVAQQWVNHPETVNFDSIVTLYRLSHGPRYTCHAGTRNNYYPLYGQGSTTGPCKNFSFDINADYKIDEVELMVAIQFYYKKMLSLSRLLRVIQFYNSDGYTCDQGTEDGYAPINDPSSCVPHQYDTLKMDNTPGVDFIINRREVQNAIDDYNAGKFDMDILLRYIQFYNSGGYRCATPSDHSEDAYVALPDPNNPSCKPSYKYDHDGSFTISMDELNIAITDYYAKKIDWTYGLSRAIQFMAMGGYTCAVDTEDGFVGFKR